MRFIKPYIYIAASLLLTINATTVWSKDPKANYISPCKCTHCKGHDRWAEKIDTEMPDRKSKKVTPSILYDWNGAGGHITKSGTNAKRITKEQEWLELTGRVVLVRAEGDGDLHVQLIDVDAKDPDVAPNVVVEIPSNTETETNWCSIRKTIFSWSSNSFPFSSSDKKLKLLKYPVITVIGKAFYDIDHAPKGDMGNKRTREANVSVWEVHPVMKMDVIKEH